MQHTKEIKVPNESSLTARDFQNNPGKVDAAFVRAAVLCLKLRSVLAPTEQQRKRHINAAAAAAPSLAEQLNSFGSDRISKISVSETKELYAQTKHCYYFWRLTIFFVELRHLD